MPLALLALAGGLIEDGYEVILVDGCLYEVEDAHARVLEACEGALFYGTTGIDGLKCSQAVRSRYPDLPSIIGGWFAGSSPELTLRSGAYDAVAIGQGELLVRDLAAAISSGEDLESVASLALLRDGQLVRTAPRPAVTWDQIPRMAWNLLRVGDWRDPQSREPDRGTVGKGGGLGRPPIRDRLLFELWLPIALHFLLFARL
jgi:anaerobic magnesium-protoporphyrin IX monomethyl ester cyclase